MPHSDQPMTLPARYYTDETVFRREMERFYFGRWMCAGREERIALPGDYFLCEVAGASVIVTRDVAGEVRAFYNVCRHRGTRICTEQQGRFDNRIRCPYHGWTYALDGCLIGAPHMESAGFSREEYPLRSIRAEVWEGHVFLNFSDRPVPLLEQLAGLTEKFAGWRMADLRRGRRIVYNVAANWKLIVLNYNECLHCPLVHPALNLLTDYQGADNDPPSAACIGGVMGFRNGAETMSMDGVRRRAYLPGLSEAERKMVAYYVVYPNLMLSLHPDYMMVHTLWPKSAGRTEVVCEWHFDPEEMSKTGFQSDDAVEFWDKTNREDWTMCELSQAGIGSRGYTPGPYSSREELLHAFDCVVTAGEETTSSSEA